MQSERGGRVTHVRLPDLCDGEGDGGREGGIEKSGNTTG